ncbi:helix-turn-helix domain-containing protein [Tumebacillus permanentifrigoris]|uniref:AraC-like DNA-binding protein n=1 Tax=Tumebacillus permanentifrigoris TaxID=378543 RepID=A0A316D5T8_9BACL|nr:AraC family transcriptional regulator [Tumebacillus permanentifrigoris]PWK09606.1 AraC-like DNA-binding protein [Tumebacillus permanentifrigoris]
MVSERYPEIDEVIAYIHQHLNEPFSLAELAALVSYSPYHFTRIFKETIGLPPQYYVSSHRLQKAKDLLLHTDLSIREVGLEIGQQSLGTFTTRFTQRVGVTPAAFRQSRVQVDEHLNSLQQLPDWSSLRPVIEQDARIAGTIQAAVPFDGLILLGLFARPIPEGLPLYGTLLSSLGEFCLTGVKPGIYYLMATSVSWNMHANDILLPQATLRTRTRVPIHVQPYTAVPFQHVTLLPPSPDDPPILISLPLLMKNFLSQAT